MLDYSEVTSGQTTLAARGIPGLIQIMASAGQTVQTRTIHVMNY